MGDDLSMFLAVGALLHQLLCFEATPSQRQKYTVAILGSLVPVSVYHVWADEIYVHEITFAIMVFLVARRVRRLIKKQVKSHESRKKLGSMATFGTCKSTTLLRVDILLTNLKRLVFLATSYGPSTSTYVATSQHLNTTLVFHGDSFSNFMAGGTF
jgi:hypothetical protein